MDDSLAAFPPLTREQQIEMMTGAAERHAELAAFLREHFGPVLVEKLEPKAYPEPWKPKPGETEPPF